MGGVVRNMLIKCVEGLNVLLFHHHHHCFEKVCFFFIQNAYRIENKYWCDSANVLLLLRVQCLCAFLL